MSEEVKWPPCPFCGEAPYSDYGQVICYHYDCFMYRNEPVPAQDWNTRAPTDREKKMMDLLDRAEALLSDAEGIVYDDHNSWLAELEELRK